MSMISAMFERLNLHALTDLLRYGTSETELLSSGTCEEREKNSEKEFLDACDALALEPLLTEKIMNICYTHQSETNDIYFELGMKAGVALYRKLIEGIPADAQAVIDKVAG